MERQEIYERARQSRDPRFDGRFFIGVRTTGIYCRPICPATIPKPENVSFYPTAAAAAEAGYRPCLRCRPECAPGSPAWNGTSTTVSRGLRLIDDGALDDGGVERLADRLGVTGRHLRRLFTEHVGASPLAVAHTRRLHFAKRLVDQTHLPMGDIAIAAGFGSVRRFNDAFRQAYGRAPRDLRRHTVATKQDRQAPLEIRVPVIRPYDWPGLLAFFAARAIPDVEAVRSGEYVRTVRCGGRPGLVQIRFDERSASLLVTFTGVETPDLLHASQRVRDLADADAPVQTIHAVLGRDAKLAAALEAHPGIRVPGAWDGFELAVRAIAGQQVSVAAATTIAGRIAGRYGEPLTGGVREAAAGYGLTHLFPAAGVLERARFNKLGLVGSRIAAIRAVARATRRGDICFEAGQDPAAFGAAFTALPGIGGWTAQYVAMRALKDPDALPVSDLGLLRAFDGDDRPRMRPRELSARAEAWRPWRAYAARLLWSLDPGSGG